MMETEPQHLRVLIANEKRERLELLAQVVTGLGHDVIAREIYVKEVGAATERERPDVALVGLGLSSEHALGLIAEIVREASCPVIALLSAKDPGYVREASKRGVFAYIVDGDAEELQSAIDITVDVAQSDSRHISSPPPRRPVAFRESPRSRPLVVPLQAHRRGRSSLLVCAPARLSARRTASNTKGGEPKPPALRSVLSRCSRRRPSASRCCRSTAQPSSRARRRSGTTP